MWLTVLLVLMLTTPADRQAQAIARTVESHYHSAITLRASFLERYSQGHQSVRVESGTVFFSRPGRMRWEYESPEYKLFVVDGKTAWFYVPADRTATRAPVRESADSRTPFALLTGKTKLSRLCGRIELLDPSARTAAGFHTLAAGHAVLRCLPRVHARANPINAVPLTDTDEDFTEVLLAVDPRSGEMDSVLVKQPGGVEIEYRFGNWQRDLELSEALFHFEAPSGVSVLSAPQGSSSP